jgi:hypothetical protein
MTRDFPEQIVRATSNSTDAASSIVAIAVQDLLVLVEQRLTFRGVDQNRVCLACEPDMRGESSAAGARLGDHSLHPMTPGLFAIDEMADHLHRAPLAGHRPGQELLGSQVGDSATELHRSFKIGLDQSGWAPHATLSWNENGTCDRDRVRHDRPSG